MTNVVIPMAGAGRRFTDAGYTVPKPLLEVDGVHMLQKVVWGCNMGGRYIYIVQKSHSEEYNLKELLPTFTPALDVVVLEVDEITEGAAASVLVAKEYIDNDELLVICDSDGLVEWDPIKFLVEVGEGRHLDGAIATFSGEGSRWSYVELNEKNLASKVVEKEQISSNACAGVYYWRHGSDFVAYAEDMIAKDERVNGEFYVAPVYNKAIEDQKAVGIYNVDSYTSLGTPEDYEKYTKSNTN
jgi:dTDP-glucose pyrophosphorylase